MKTSVDNIYACGDINGRIMLAHSAFKMGEVAAENAVKGTAVKCDLSYVPSCLYLSPEAASVGLTEEKAKELIAFLSDERPIQCIVVSGEKKKEMKNPPLL